MSQHVACWWGYLRDKRGVRGLAIYVKKRGGVRGSCQSLLSVWSKVTNGDCNLQAVTTFYIDQSISLSLVIWLAISMEQIFGIWLGQGLLDLTNRPHIPLSNGKRLGLVQMGQIQIRPCSNKSHHTHHYFLFFLSAVVNCINLQWVSRF